jgi:peptidoglycan/xylan/chitin deacetylase (PgdA/CDA1 family)
MKRALRRAIAGIAPPAPSGGVRVLLYHAIGEPDPADRLALRVSREAFRAQMDVLRDEAYAVVPLSAVCEPPPRDGRRRVAITFDDGYQSQAWAAALLRELGFPATFFLVPRFLDGVSTPHAYWESWGHLRWDDVTTLMDAGFSIGAHSMTHVDLRRCAREHLETEVADAKAVLEARAGKAVDSFSYPYGRHDGRVRDAVEAAGYQVACTSRYGANRRAVARYRVHRTEVAGTDRLVDFRRKLAGQYDWLGTWQDLTAAR